LPGPRYAYELTDVWHGEGPRPLNAARMTFPAEREREARRVSWFPAKPLQPRSECEA